MRWPRLSVGFREVDAPVLIVVALSAPEPPTLSSAADGVVAVDLPPLHPLRDRRPQRVRRSRGPRTAAAELVTLIADGYGRNARHDSADPQASIADAITLGAVVNPADSTNASGITVELVAAKTLAGANSGR